MIAGFVWLGLSTLALTLTLVLAWSTHKSVIKKGDFYGPRATPFGLELPEDASPGVIAHEKVHLWTGSTWICVLSRDLLWTFFYFYCGYWLPWSILLGYLVTVVIYCWFEWVADIGAILVRGYRAYLSDLDDVYKRVWWTGRQGWTYWFFMTTHVVCYPPWRLIPILRIKRELDGQTRMGQEVKNDSSRGPDPVGSSPQPGPGQDLKV